MLEYILRQYVSSPDLITSYGMLFLDGMGSANVVRSPPAHPS